MAQHVILETADALRCHGTLPPWWCHRTLPGALPRRALPRLALPAPGCGIAVAAVGPCGPGRSRRSREFADSRWKDVFELTEWFRPGTIKKDANFDPNKM